jgi:hypothetical protein
VGLARRREVADRDVEREDQRRREPPRRRVGGDVRIRRGDEDQEHRPHAGRRVARTQARDAEPQYEREAEAAVDHAEQLRVSEHVRERAGHDLAAELRAAGKPDRIAERTGGEQPADLCEVVAIVVERTGTDIAGSTEHV